MGAQFQINTYTTNSQFTGSVAADADGDFVVVWTSTGSSATDTSGYSVQGQRYASGGFPRGAQLQVNTYTTNQQGFGGVASDADGDFVVVWDSDGSSGTDTSSFSIQAQRYTSDGSPRGAQFQVNTYTTDGQGSSAVAMDADGDFVVAWLSVGSSGSDSSQTSIQGQRYASDGTPRGSQFQVNTLTLDFQIHPSVAMDADGDFVVAWEAYSYAESIRGQRFASDGSPRGAEFQVNTGDAIPERTAPSVAADADGDFVVVWGSEQVAFPPWLSADFVSGRRYASDGSPQGPQFEIPSYTTGLQRDPAVSIDATGDFVVVWLSYGSSGTDASSGSIQGRRFASDGSTLGTQFQVNTYTTNKQYGAVLASDATGNFVVAWSSAGSLGTDASGYSIQGQRYRVSAAAPAVPAMSRATRYALAALLMLLGAAYVFGRRR